MRSLYADRGIVCLDLGLVPPPSSDDMRENPDRKYGKACFNIEQMRYAQNSDVLRQRTSRE